MKKLILLSTIFSLFATKLVAQENPAPASTSTPATTQEALDSSKPKKEKREQRYENASPEKKERMDKRRDENKGLSKEERKKKREENRSDSRENKDSSDNQSDDKNQIAGREDGYKNQPYGRGEGRGRGGNGRYANASPEQKEKMDKHREMMRSLTPEQRELVKKEMERHRAEMKKITGFDLPSPRNPDQQNERPE